MVQPAVVRWLLGSYFNNFFISSILKCFIEEYNVQGKSFYIFEGHPKTEHKLPIPRIDIDKYVYIS